jgi:hypothetical protein
VNICLTEGIAPIRITASMTIRRITLNSIMIDIDDGAVVEARDGARDVGTTR